MIHGRVDCPNQKTKLIMNFNYIRLIGVILKYSWSTNNSILFYHINSGVYLLNL